MENSGSSKKSLADATPPEEDSVPSNLVPTMDALQHMIKVAVEAAFRAREHKGGADFMTEQGAPLNGLVRQKAVK
ncbi:hypothetical protein NDU88_001342 [Pleurodeles waltl]|uniref:Uncharacterized protein n=1 Tax=Pleurodeles waltl TaxID=8319 RepID=A0AAV7MJF7_PLEWA|nr:hypothetical protein NDU88_001342 [Pleurodeles waltl]